MFLNTKRLIVSFTTIYNYVIYPTGCLLRPEDYSSNFWRIYRIILIISGGFIVYCFSLHFFITGMFLLQADKIKEVKLFRYELTHATKYITAVCIKNILGKRLLLGGDFTFFMISLSVRSLELAF